MIKDELSILEELLGEDFHTDVSMKRHTTFKTGGNADFFICPQSIETMAQCLKILAGSDYAYYIVGNGSNIIVPDSGIRGVVVSTKGLRGLEVRNNTVTAFAGNLNAEVSRFAMNNSLGGMEFLSGIPGTIGGAVYMNAGAYEHEISHILTSATYVTPKGDIRTISKDEIDYGYRKSIFMQKDVIIVGAEFELFEKDKDEIEAYTADLNQRRRDKQPLSYPSAGSVFKRPVGHYAGKLIEDAGLKGYRIGGAMVSEKHAGFIINYDNATSTDILDLIRYVQDVVFEKFGVKLENEVKILGSR
ncbi:MAG: UDP-N-acetylmuramate dehydrogenase [Anaerofustis stercorihominis]|nr:UDP-N-acetylmuramate dehydrogenase [Anaerofustis stercorihominis]